eukprot:1934702-Pleurochrysis_carterae.AAC.1
MLIVEIQLAGRMHLRRYSCASGLCQFEHSTVNIARAPACSAVTRPPCCLRLEPPTSRWPHEALAV